MALTSCPDCKKDVSEKALTCPQCGAPLGPGLQRARERRRWVLGGVVAVIVGGGVFAMRRPSDYDKVEELRAEQEELGTHTERVQQRFFRLYKEHPNDAMYVYLWARCVDDPAKQLELAQEGMRVDPRFSWNYNLAARDLARVNKVAEGYEIAVKGAEIDPASMPLAEVRGVLKLMVDRKLDAQPKPVPSGYTSYESKENFEKGAVRYKGVFRGGIRSPERSDLEAIERSRLSTYKGPVSDAVKGFVVCANRYADACIRTYVPNDARFEPIWEHTAADVTAIKENRLVSVAGSVVTNGRGENIMLADAVAVEAP